MTAILTCSSLTKYVDAAQKAIGTDYPVTVISRDHHADPSEMKDHIIDAVSRMPENVDTILVSMGFCGGTWDHVTFQKKVVIPRVDDCISILLQTDDNYIPNRKQLGHLYIYEDDPSDFSALNLLHDGGTADETYRNMSRDDLFRYWFGNYHAMDIIDTGLNLRCYDVDYVEAAQKEADMINADLGYAEGSNRMLEKLVSGRWDKQFIVAEPGKVIKHSDFFE